MRAKLLNTDPPVTYAVVLDTGDEVIGSLTKFISERDVEAASITGIGAFLDAVLGYFDWQTKEYRRIPVNEQVEVLSLLGDVAVSEGEPTLLTIATGRTPQPRPASQGRALPRHGGDYRHCWFTRC